MSRPVVGVLGGMGPEATILLQQRVRPPCAHARRSRALRRSSHTAVAMSTGSLLGPVRGGGRLYSEPPLAGYTEEEMVAEAQQRHAHNRQRRRLKQLLSAASEDGSTVATKDLLLAAKLAKMDLPEEMVADTPYATGVDGVGARARPSAHRRRRRAWPV